MFGIENYAEKITDLGDALLFGGAMVLIGMATIFSVLIIIWISLVVLKFFLHDIPAERKAHKAEKPVEITPEPVAYAPTPTNNDEIVAVIAAAIAAAESEDSGLKFRVVSFKRK